MEIIDLLCSQGADLTVKDAKGNTPLHLVLNRAKKDWEGQLPFIKILAKYGADATLKNAQGFTAHDIIRQLIKEEMGIPVDYTKDTIISSAYHLWYEKGIDMYQVWIDRADEYDLYGHTEDYNETEFTQ